MCFSGPAYGLITAMNKQVQVMANGHQSNLIASYDFLVHLSGEYSIWILAYGTSRDDNGVQFRIDNEDDILWDTTHIASGGPMWQQYMMEVSMCHFE